jgi:hypothetical protein
MPNNNREYNNGPSINNRYINDPKVKGDIKKNEYDPKQKIPKLI